LASCPTGRGRAEESLEVDVLIFHSRVGASLLGTHKHRILCEGRPQLQSWAGSCLIEDEPFRVVVQLKTSLWNPEINV